MGTCRALGTLAMAVSISALSAVVVGAPAAFAKSPSCADAWTNSAGGTWATGSNWSTGAAPTASQAACVTIPLSAPVVLSNGAGSAASLTLGGTSGLDELELEGATLILGSASSVASTGELVAEGSAGTIDMRSGVLTNQGTLEATGNGIQLYGDVTNAAQGLVLVTSGSELAVDTGVLTNSGELSVDGTLEAPDDGDTGAVIDNAGGTIQNQGAVDVDSGGTFEEGAGAVIGTAPLVENGTLELTGDGASSFELLGDLASATLSGNIAAGQTVLLAGSVATSGALTNDGTITVEPGVQTLTLPGTDTLTNDGTILVTAGNGLDLAGDVSNGAKGTIAAAGGGLTLQGAVTLTNDGTIEVGSNGSISADSAATIDAAGGTIAVGGSVTVAVGATFVEGKGTTSGGMVGPISGTLDLAGTGASSFELYNSTLSGNVAAAQTLWVQGHVDPTASFTNDGTMFFVGAPDSALDLPSGGTLTNDGTLEADRAMAVTGNLTNAPDGVISEESLIEMSGYGTTFDNEGTLDLLMGGNVEMGAEGSCSCGGGSNNTFDNTGTIYWGIDSAGQAWGGTNYDSANIGGGNIELGGTIVPVPNGEPTGSGSEITYAVVSDAVSCTATVSDGWSIGCGGDGAGDLFEPDTSLGPTEVTVTGSGTSGTYGWSSTYGQPVTLSATVSAQDGSTPTGKVAFYAVQQDSGSPVAIGPDLLGTPTLSTTAGVTTATLTYNPPPGNYDLVAWYKGDSTELPASMSSLDACDCTQTVGQQTTGVTLGSSRASSVFGSPVTFTATVTPGAYGPANPTGLVTFFDGGTLIGSASVATKSGITTAKLTTDDLPVGSDSITASYSGNFAYGGSTTSSAHSQSVKAPTASKTVKIKGSSEVGAGATYQATATTDGNGAVLFVLASTPAPPKGMTIDSATGKVSFAVPDAGTSGFSYAVVASNAAGRAESSVVTVTVT